MYIYKRILFNFSVVIPTVARHNGSTLPQAPIPVYLQQPQSQQSTAFSVASNGYSSSTSLSHPGKAIASMYCTCDPNFVSTMCLIGSYLGILYIALCCLDFSISIEAIFVRDTTFPKGFVNN